MIEDKSVEGKDIVVLCFRYAALYEYKSEDGHFCELQMMKIVWWMMVEKREYKYMQSVINAWIFSIWMRTVSHYRLDFIYGLAAFS